MSSDLKIEMLSTGDEVLYGQIIDTNSAWLSDFLFQEGLKISSRFTVGDNLTQLVETLKARTQANDILIVNGGLGPTSDDMSAEAAALANNEELVLHEEWLNVMEAYFSSRGRVMSPSNRKQAILPKSASIVDNPIGTACGFKMEINGCLVIFTPGVPSEFKKMVQDQILPMIKMRHPDINKPLCYRLTTMGRSESDLATDIDTHLSVPKGISVGYRSAMPIIELKLTGQQHQEIEMNLLWQQLKSLVTDNLLYEGSIGQEDNSGLGNVVSQLLQKRTLKLVVAEQFTAGIIAYQLYQADAPLLKSEVIIKDIDDPNEYLSALRIDNQADLALAMVNFESNNSVFTLLLSTKKANYQFKLKYISRRHNKVTEQHIFAAIALDCVRRYLSNLPLIGPNIWLEVIE